MGFPLPPEGGRGVWEDTRQKSHYRPPLKPTLSMGFSKIPSEATPGRNYTPPFNGIFKKLPLQDSWALQWESATV